MIGQERLLDIFRTCCFPRFAIIVGDKGSGKKTLCKELQRLTPLMNWCFEPDVKVDTVRHVITEAYTNVSPICYVFTDADNMSGNAKNALLKVTEEPPNNSYFILTLESLSNTLETIRSRANVFYMDRYTEQELHNYALSLDDTIDDSKWQLIKSVCENPGDIKTVVMDLDVCKFYEFVDKVASHIATASGSNVFKIANDLRIKEDGTGYDLKLFFRTFISVCKNKYEETQDIKYIEGMQLTSSYLSEMFITGISKQGLVDMWILDIRKAWM